MNDVSLYISNNGKGLSHAIDAQLDAEFKAKFGIDDVKLNGNQWQSIFNLIQKDQAEQEEGQNTFTQADNNVCNNSHYKVNAGNYIIKGKVWEEIVKQVKEFLNIQETAADDVAATEDKVVKSNEENLSEILQKAGITLNEEEYLDVLSKYENKLALQMSGMDISDEKIESDILAYISGKQYEKTEDAFYNQANNNILPFDSMATKEIYVLDGVKKGLEYAKQNPNDIEGAYKLNSEGYQQFGNSQVQLYDTSGDNLVDYNEFISYEQKRAGIEYDTEEKVAAQKVFNYLDMNGNGNIDSTEMTLNGYAMSKLSDSDTVRTGDSISYTDWWATQTMLAGVGTDEQGTNQVKAQNRYQELRNLGKEVIYNYKNHLK